MAADEYGHDLGGGHRWLWDQNGDGLWQHPGCSSWHRVDLTSGTAHRARTGGKQAPLVLLSVEGSLLCERTSTHGFVVNGRWVDA